MLTRILLAATTCLLAAPFAAGFGPAVIAPRNAALIGRTMTTLSAVVVNEPITIAKTRKDLEDDLSSPTDIEIIKRPYSKEIPKVLGGVKIGLKKLVVITGASSGLGRSTTIALAKTGKYHIVMACRDVEKAKKVAKEAGLSENSYTVMKLELANLQSVRDFVANLKAFKSARPLTHLICNAAVYKPASPEPEWTDDGFEMSMGVNHLGHFMLVNLLLDDLSRAKGARVCIVGSVTGNTNTIAGKFVYPRADLGNLEGFVVGATNPVAMVDGKTFLGAKAYKDSKVCNMMTVSELNRRYHESTGIVFSSMYPGCIAESNLFREKREWFRKLFPVFMKQIGAYVDEKEAGERLAQVINDPKCDKSGAYWSWNGNAKEFGKGSAGGSGGEIFENEQSDAVTDAVTAKKMWDMSKRVVGLTEKEMYQGGQFED